MTQVQLDQMLRDFAAAYAEDPGSDETLRLARLVLALNGEQLPVEVEGTA